MYRQCRMLNAPSWLGSAKSCLGKLSCPSIPHIDNLYQASSNNLMSPQPFRLKTSLSPCQAPTTTATSPQHLDRGSRANSVSDHLTNGLRLTNHDEQPHRRGPAIQRDIPLNLKPELAVIGIVCLGRGFEVNGAVLNVSLDSVTSASLAFHFFFTHSVPCVL